jgi:hypothetical protein
MHAHGIQMQRGSGAQVSPDINTQVPHYTVQRAGYASIARFTNLQHLQEKLILLRTRPLLFLQLVLRVHMYNHVQIQIIQTVQF